MLIFRLRNSHVTYSLISLHSRTYGSFLRKGGGEERIPRWNIYVSGTEEEKRNFSARFCRTKNQWRSTTSTAIANRWAALTSASSSSSSARKLAGPVTGPKWMPYPELCDDEEWVRDDFCETGFLLTCVDKILTTLTAADERIAKNIVCLEEIFAAAFLYLLFKIFLYLFFQWLLREFHTTGENPTRWRKLMWMMVSLETLLVSAKWATTLIHYLLRVRKYYLSIFLKELTVWQ